jgi:hypothetical protein
VRIAEQHHNDDFAIPLSRLSDVETKGVTPSVYRLYTLSVIYRRDLREILSWYGIDVNVTGADLHLAAPPNSHTSTATDSSTLLQVPIALDPGFDPKKTVNLSRMIQQWGLVPITYLAKMLPGKFTYGYVGREDLTMYPLILPGTFVQIDESRTRPGSGPWNSEYERPIFFVETRSGFVCSWCSIVEDKLVLQPHPLSPVAPQTYRHPQDAEILGQVIGIAMRLGDWKSLPEVQPVRTARESLN